MKKINHKRELIFRKSILYGFLDMIHLFEKSTNKEFEEVLSRYMTGYYNNSNDGCIELQDYIMGHIESKNKKYTGIGIIDAMDKIVIAAIENGTLK